MYPESQCRRLLQENWKEQCRPLYLPFVDFTNIFDLVSRDGLFKILQNIGCPSKLISITNKLSQWCEIRLCAVVFGIFSLLLFHAFKYFNDGVYLQTRHDNNLNWIRAKFKTTCILLRDILFADYAAFASYIHDGLQRIIVHMNDQLFQQFIYFYLSQLCPGIQVVTRFILLVWLISFFSFLS